MLVLGVDSSSMHGGVGLVEDDRLVAEYVLNIAVTYSERLLPAIDRVLGDAGRTLRELAGLAVAIGPGSFTGLRIGLSTVKGLAGALGLPVVGISTLRALVWGLAFAQFPVCPILDARKGELYCALFRWAEDGWRQVMEDAALSPQVLAARLAGPTIFVGDGVAAHGKTLREVLGPQALFPPPAAAGARPAAVAVLGRERILRGEADDPVTLAPRYLRPAEAELKRAAAAPEGKPAPAEPPGGNA